jgi:hypothetical protein
MCVSIMDSRDPTTQDQQRFKLMEQWVNLRNWDELINKSDRIHMTEWSTGWAAGGLV